LDSSAQVSIGAADWIPWVFSGVGVSLLGWVIQKLRAHRYTNSSVPESRNVVVVNMNGPSAQSIVQSGTHGPLSPNQSRQDASVQAANDADCGLGSDKHIKKAYRKTFVH
jgi:hypothetical protein